MIADGLYYFRKIVVESLGYHIKPLVMSRSFQALIAVLCGLIFIYRSKEVGVTDGMAFLLCGLTIMILNFVLPWVNKRGTRSSMITYSLAIVLGVLTLASQLLVETFFHDWITSVILVSLGFFLLMTGLFGLMLKRFYQSRRKNV